MCNLFLIQPMMYRVSLLYPFYVIDSSIFFFVIFSCVRAFTPQYGRAAALLLRLACQLLDDPPSRVNLTSPINFNNNFLYP